MDSLEEVLAQLDSSHTHCVLISRQVFVNCIMSGQLNTILTAEGRRLRQMLPNDFHIVARLRPVTKGRRERWRVVEAAVVRVGCIPAGLSPYWWEAVKEDRKRKVSVLSRRHYRRPKCTEN